MNQLHRIEARRVAGLVFFEAATLAAASLLHLTAGGRSGYGAGIPEALIAVALVVGAVSLRGPSPRGRSVAVGTTAFAIFGFVVGLTITIRGGDPANLAYHLVMLPLLGLTLRLLIHGPGARSSRSR